MSEEVGNLVLEQLRMLEGEMASLRSKMSERLDISNTRLESLEHAASGIAYVLVETRGQLLGQAERIDRLEQSTI